MKKRLRLFTALGPGDIVGARKTQLAGKVINETSIAFSEQILAYCHLAGIKALAVSSNSRIDSLKDAEITLENRPKPFPGCGGIRFHLSLIFYGIYLAFRARRFKADIAIIDSGTTHYFVLTIFRALGIPVAVNLHNVLWPRGYPPAGLVAKTVRQLNRLFFQYTAAAAIGVSPECERQVIAELRDAIPFFQYRCQFRRDGFALSRPYQGGTFRIVFAGRAEENKGLLDVARMAGALRALSPVKVVFDVCGDGPAIADLTNMVQQGHLEDHVIIHGRLEREALLRVYASAHAVIVPTRSSFTEGMPQVCAEAMLSGLPVITSQVANAFDVIGPATVRAEADDIELRSFNLVAPRRCSLYSRLRAACHSLSLQFLDRAQSYPAACDRLLQAITDQRSLCLYAGVFENLS